MARYINKSIVKGQRALDLFTNRSESLAAYIRWLNVDPSPGKVAVFHGDGGNGKSLLLRYMAERISKRLSDQEWKHVSALPVHRQAAAVEAFSSSRRVPVAFLDLQHDAEPREALLKLRRILSEDGFRFPLFDFAIIELMRKDRMLTDEELERVFAVSGSAELQLASDLVDLAQSSMVIGAAAAISKYVMNRFGDRFSHFMREREIRDEDVSSVRDMAATGELLDVLPNLFADDLNANMRSRAHSERVVLIFDTHEALWRTDRKLTGLLYFQRDEWLRRLVDTLELTQGIVVVISGREPVRWQVAGEYPIPSEKLMVIPVGDFSSPDAQEYLRGAGIKEALWPTLLSAAKSEDDEFHPFRLGLGVDATLAAVRQLGEVWPSSVIPLNHDANLDVQLANRLLSYVDVDMRHAVAAMSAARSFDFPLFREVGKALGFSASLGDFDVLTDFSFVRRLDQSDPPRFRLHDALRRLAPDERYTETRRRSNVVLKTHYQAIADNAEEMDRGSAQIESVYHTNQLDGAEGIELWLKTFRDHLKLSQYAFCRRLILLVPELRIDSSYHSGCIDVEVARLYARLANYQNALASYQAAASEFEKDIRLNDAPVGSLVEYGRSLVGKGDIELETGLIDDAHKSYLTAITLFRRSLKILPEDAYAHYHLARSLNSLANVDVGLKRYEGALKQLDLALSEYRLASELAPERMDARVDHADTLKRKGEFLVKLGDRDIARDSLLQAIGEFEAILEEDPMNLGAQNNRASAHLIWGRLEFEDNQWEASASHYDSAVQGFEVASRLAPESVTAHRGRGESLTGRGILEFHQARLSLAANSLADAVKSFDQALDLAPDRVDARAGRRSAYTALAEVLVATKRSTSLPDVEDLLKKAQADLDHQAQTAPETLDAQSERSRLIAIQLAATSTLGEKL